MPQPERVHFCGRTETLLQQPLIAPWPVRRITWNVAPRGSGIDADQVNAAFEAAWRDWAQYIQIEPTHVRRTDHALVRSKFGRTGNNILAWSELADGTQTEKHQLYSNSGIWTWHHSPPPTLFDLQRVAAHEIGHVLGLVHDWPESGTLMQPTYDAAIRSPTTRDVLRLVLLGYAPRVA